MTRRVVAAFISLAVVLGGAAVAWAYWTSTDASHAAQASADTLPAGQTPTATIAFPSGVATATVTFNRSTTTAGRTVDTFLIKRYSSASGGTAAATFPCTPGGSGASVSCTESAVPAGTWYYTDTPTVAGSNWVGAESGRSNSVATDTTAPTVAYSQSPTANGGGYNNTTVTVTLTATDNVGGTGVARINYSIDSGASVQVNASTASFPVTGDGTHTVTYTATDNAGNTSAQTTQTIKIDSTPPSTPVISGYPNYINIANKAAVNVSGTAEAGVSMSVTLTDTNSATKNATTTATGGNWSVSFDASSLADGPITISAVATDLADNTASASPVQIAKDTVAPAAPAITTPTSNSYINSANNGASFTVSGTRDPNTSIALAVSDANAVHVLTGSVSTTSSASWSTTINTTSLNDGTITYSAVATDAAGNPSTPGTTTNTKDTVGPAVAFTSPAANGYINIANNSATFTVSGSKDANASVALTVSDGNTAHNVTASVGATASTTWSVTVDTRGLNQGTITFTAVATETSGNTTTVTRTNTKDILAPTVSTMAMANSDGQAARNDTFKIAFSEQVDASTICSTWTNSGTQSLNGQNQVVVTITDAGTNDRLTVSTASGCAVNLGTIALGANYVSATTTFGGTGNNASTIDLTTAGVLTITLGAASGNTTNSNVLSAAPVYTPAAGIKDLAGNTMSTSAVTGTSSRF